LSGSSSFTPGVGLVDILRIAGERRPAERTDPPAEERADIGGHEAREGEGVFQPFLLNATCRMLLP
jgi:hypothetical protein